MPNPELESLSNFLYEMGLLKRSKRTGWLIAGVDNPESIAEHTFRTAIIGYLLARMEGADPHKTATLCLFHDTQESRIGDVPSVGKAYVVTAPTRRSPPTRWPGSPRRLVRRCGSWSMSMRPGRAWRRSWPGMLTSWSA